MKKILFLILTIGYITLSMSQSNKIVPIILDGKPAYMNTTTGKVVTKKEALSKKYKKIKLNGFSSASSVDNNVEQQFYSAEGEHVVSSGETLYSISRKYGLSVSSLKKINNLQSNAIKIGQVLQLKNQDNAGVVEQIANKFHVVSKNETLYSISKLYGISVSELKKRNNLIENTIHVGDKLMVQ